MVSYLKHPMVLALTALIAVLVPGLALLARAYEEARDQYFDSSLPAVPTDTEIAVLARRLSPEETVLRLTGNVHAPDSPPRSGLVRVEAATDDRGGEYYVAVIRHDIACATCNNLLMAVLVSTDEGEIREVVALAPWGVARRAHGSKRVPDPIRRPPPDRRQVYQAGCRWHQWGHPYGERVPAPTDGSGTVDERSASGEREKAKS